MRAQPVNISAYVFDFDDTIAVTDAKIKVLRNGVFQKELTPKQFNTYKLLKGETYNFDDFHDGELILKAKKYKMWPLINNISKAIHEDGKVADIYILTARSNQVKSFIYEFLKRNGIEIDIKHVLTIGDHPKNTTVSAEKHRLLTALTQKYKKVFFFDDDSKNIELARGIEGVRPLLVETLTQNRNIK